jgi:peroxiredoxin
MRYLFPVLVAFILLSACRTQRQIAQTRPANQMDSISYALGYDLGNNLKKAGIEFDAATFLQALQDQEAGALELSDAEKQALLVQLQQLVSEKNPPAAPAGVAVGRPAPEISLPTPDGTTLNLSDLRGKIVLIDFWASWCRPCRMENPAVVAAYKKYKDKGFEILGVSLDRDKAQWLGAIEKDGLTWPHVSDLKFWQSEAAKTYSVHSIPYTVLVDAKGNVIAERLRGAALDRKLAELLGN